MMLSVFALSVMAQESTAPETFKRWNIGLNLGAAIPTSDYSTAAYVNTGAAMSIDAGYKFGKGWGLAVKWFGNSLPFDNVKASNYDITYKKASDGIGGFLVGLQGETNGKVKFTGRILAGYMAYMAPDYDGYANNNPSLWFKQKASNTGAIGFCSGIGVAFKLSELISLELQSNYITATFEFKDIGYSDFTGNNGIIAASSQTEYATFDAMVGINFHF